LSLLFKISTSSNRTIVGLKLHCIVHVSLNEVRSNRTIVGLKLRHNFRLGWDPVLQQSHHCGIETAMTFNYIRTIELAAIAPLWD